jgi:hypothetical protein
MLSLDELGAEGLECDATVFGVPDGVSGDGRRQDMHGAGLNLGSVGRSCGVRAHTKDWRSVAMSVGSKDGRNVEAPAVAGALKGVLRENDGSHFIGLSTGKDYGKSIEGRLRVSDIGGVEGRAASELDVVFVALDNKGHNDGGSSGHVGESERDVS